MKLHIALITPIFAALMSFQSLHAATLDLETATILDLQKAYDEGLTSEKVVSVYLERIAAYDQKGCGA
jgi:amidase